MLSSVDNRNKTMLYKENGIQFFNEFNPLASIEEKFDSYFFAQSITLLMAQWVWRLFEIKSRVFLMLFDSLGAIRQISSLESASSRVAMHQHALSA